jgi:selenocysteine-specific translation elongation factor
MKCINVAVLGDNALCRELGKRGTASDFAIYNHRQGGDTLCFVEPTLYPDKLQPLLYALSMCDAALLVVKAIDKTLGEIIVALDALQVPGFAVLEAPAEQFSAVAKGTVAEKYETLERDAIKIRERMLTLDVQRSERAFLPIDHFFDVKSVGTVVLGSLHGTLRVHDELVLYPAGKQVSVRSLQVQDEDVKEASNTRVGVALKGAGVEYLDRGYALARKGECLSGDKINASVRVSKYCREGLSSGDAVHVSLGLQFVPAKAVLQSDIKAGGEGSATLKCGKAVAFRRGDKALITKPEAKMRIVGAAVVA